MENSKLLRDRIHKELDFLLSNFNGNSNRVLEIVQLFINETPTLVEKIAENLDQKKWTEASELIHKIKARYGYIGLDEVAAVISHWENDLLEHPEQINSQEVIEYLKQKTEAVIRELKETQYTQQGEPTQPTSQRLAGKLVLIAEDDEVNAMVFDLFVKETGASTIIASDGIQALQLAGEKKPDMIFMDVHMPFYSGLDVIKDLRRVGFSQPIVSLSASTRLNERQNSLDSGANDFLVKPANRDSITKALFKYLE